MKFAKYFAAAAVSAAFAIAPATAATVGMADLAITGLVIINNQGAPVTSGIVIDSETRTGNATASFNAQQGTGIGDANKSSVNLFGPAPNNGVVDVGYRCAGSDCGTASGVYGGTIENNADTHLGQTGLNFAIGDMLIAGSSIQPNGANGLTRADSSVSGPDGLASANATIANSVTAIATFTAQTTQQAGFALGYNAYLAALVNVLQGAHGAALSTISWVLTLQEVVNGQSTDILSWTPGEINRGLTSREAGQNATYSNSGFIFSNLVTLTAGNQYKLTINQASNSLAAEIRDVPEPGSMVLVALGLFALGAASRRRNK